MENVNSITDSNFKSFINDEMPVLVDFWAPWCGPCIMLSPIMEELAEDFNGKVKFGKLNVDENNGTAASFGIQGIPTIKVFKGGKEVFSQSGTHPKEYWIQELNRIL